MGAHRRRAAAGVLFLAAAALPLVPAAPSAVAGGAPLVVSSHCMPDLSTIEEQGANLIFDPMTAAIEDIASSGGLPLDLPIGIAVPATVAPGEAFHATISSTLPLGALTGFIQDTMIEPQIPGGVTLSAFQLVLGDRDPRATLEQPAPVGTTLDVSSFALSSSAPVDEPPLLPTVTPDLVSIAIGDFDEPPAVIWHPDPDRTGYIVDRDSPAWTATVDVDVLTDPLGTPGTTIDLLPGDVEFNLGLRLEVKVGSTPIRGRVHADWACTPDAPDTPLGQVTYESPAVGLQVVKDADASTVLAGDDAGWTITVLNTGTTPLTGVVLDDPLEPSCDRVIGDLAALGSTVVTCATSTSALDVGELSNTAVVGSDQTGADADEDGATTTVSAGCAPPGPFSDVTETHPFCAHIAWLVAEGIANGYADGGFHPAAPITRQAMSAFLYRAAGSPDGVDPVCGAAPFPDVAVSHPFCGEIAWMATAGIAGGYADGGFHPGDPVSRQAMSAFLYRAEGSPDGVDPVCWRAGPFPDVAVSHPFCGEIGWMATAGVAGGYADGGFHPADPVSRQAMAAFLARAAALV